MERFIASTFDFLDDNGWRSHLCLRCFDEGSSVVPSAMSAHDPLLLVNMAINALNSLMLLALLFAWRATEKKKGAFGVT